MKPSEHPDLGNTHWAWFSYVRSFFHVKEHFGLFVSMLFLFSYFPSLCPSCRVIIYNLCCNLPNFWPYLSVKLLVNCLLPRIVLVGMCLSNGCCSKNTSQKSLGIYRISYWKFWKTENVEAKPHESFPTKICWYSWISDMDIWKEIFVSKILEYFWQIIMSLRYLATNSLFCCCHQCLMQWRELWNFRTQSFKFLSGLWGAELLILRCINLLNL